MSYLKRAASRAGVPQNKPLPGSGQVKNPAGGYTWQAGDWARLRRFLILGTEDGSYYAGQQELTFANVEVLNRCIEQDAVRTISEVVNVSIRGRAPKQDPGIYALAYMAASDRQDVREAALAAVPVVCRTGSTLFMFLSFLVDDPDKMRGWGRGLRRAVTHWYLSRDPKDLAYQAVKYRQRYGWTHRDALREAHPYAKEGGYLGFATLPQRHEVMARTATRMVIDWIAHGHKDEYTLDVSDMHTYMKSIEAYELLRLSTTSKGVVKIVNEYGNAVPREAIPANLINADVWEELLKARMPIGALIRNLATMSRPDKDGRTVLTGTSSATARVIQQLSSAHDIAESRIHPMNLFLAARTYASGRSVRGDAQWTPVPSISDALNDAYYLAFGNAPELGRLLIAFDVSGSMNINSCMGVPGTTCREASVAMSLPLMVNNPYDAIAFSDGSRGNGYIGNRGSRPGTEISLLTLSPRQRITDVCEQVNNLNFGATDCALPMLWAGEQGREYDGIVIYTDNETWYGNTHPSVALEQYRSKTGLNTKLFVHAMTSGGSSICDPRDSNSLDMVGLDAAAPGVMAEFFSA